MDGSNPYIPSYTATQAISEEAAYMTADLMRAATTSSYSSFGYFAQFKDKTTFPSFTVASASNADKFSIVISLESTV